MINLNGKVYDPIVGLFLSPDPIVQFAGDPLNYNRYSYVLNNPLKYVDPSGYRYAGISQELQEIIDDLWRSVPVGGGGYFSFNNGSVDAGNSYLWNGNNVWSYETGQIVSGGSVAHYSKSGNRIFRRNTNKDDYIWSRYSHTVISVDGNNIFDSRNASGGYFIDYDEIDPVGILQQDANGDYGIIFATSTDVTLATPYGGYTYETGDIDMGKGAKKFTSHGKSYGVEASFGYNIIFILPISKSFTPNHIEGTSYVYAGNFWYFSSSISGNSSSGYPEDSFGDSYISIKFGIGLGIGFSTSKTNTQIWRAPENYDPWRATIKF